MAEVCRQFATTDERRTILAGLLDLRQKLRDAGISGFQWLGGSYFENVETVRGRPPGDVDVVTWVATPRDPKLVRQALDSDPQLDHDWIKATLHVDHYDVPLGSDPELVVDECRYWCGLFSHRRGDDLWKGMAHVDLSLTGNDDDARSLLNGATP